jgi:hypothetical protein
MIFRMDSFSAGIVALLVGEGDYHGHPASACPTFSRASEVIGVPGIGDRLRSESVIGFARNQRSASFGISDRLGSESVIDLPRNTHKLGKCSLENYVGSPDPYGKQGVVFTCDCGTKYLWFKERDGLVRFSEIGADGTLKPYLRRRPWHKWVADEEAATECS